MNIEKIIKNNTIEKEYVIVREMEDLITDIYKSKPDTDIIDDEKFMLYKIKPDDFNIKIHSTIDELIDRTLLPNFLLDIYDDLVFYGSKIRSCLVDSKQNNIEINKEIKWELFISTYIEIDDIDQKFLSAGYEKSETQYYKIHNSIIINFIVNKFKSAGEILLYNPYLTRFGIYRNEFICTAMFIIEYNLNIKHINSKKFDPKFGTEIDLFYLNKKTSKPKSTIFDLIKQKDYEGIVNLTEYNFNITFEDLTPIEFALKLYKQEECEIISNQLKLIIHELLRHVKFFRLPGFYAELIKLYEVDSEMYDILTNDEYKKIRTNIKPYKSITELNYSLLQFYIDQDNDTDFYKYIKLYTKKIDSHLVEYIYESNPKKIIITGIQKNYFNQSNIYKIILFSQDLEYIDLIEFDINIAMNYIDKIIENCLLRSFYFLYKKDQSILTFKNEDGYSILHNISQKNKFQEMIKLILTLNIDVLKIKNNDGLTPILYHCQQENYLIVQNIIDFINEKNKSLDKNKSLFDVDSNGNTILHLLSRSDKNLKLIKTFIYEHLELLDQVNNLNETAILVAAKNSAENILFFLKSLDANLSICDQYGNSIYHYICLNAIVLGSVIENKPNIFGYTPADYCEISAKYYYFLD